MYFGKRLIGALALAVMVVAAPALAGEERTEKSAAQEPGKKSAQKSGEKRSSELERCKKEASGKKGPERGNFMTECLAEQGKAK